MIHHSDIRNAAGLLVSITTGLILAGCTSTSEMLAQLTPDKAAQLSDRQICDRIFWVEEPSMTVFRSEVDRRGLSLNRCCFDRIIGNRAYCQGQMVRSRDNDATFPPSESVALILDQSTIKRPYATIGRLAESWEERSGTGVALDSDVGPLLQKQFVLSEYGARPLPVSLVEERFDEHYRARAREVGAHALVLTVAERFKFEAPVLLGQTATTTRKGERFRIHFEAIRFTD